MKLPHVQFTVRRMMAALAVVALLLIPVIWFITIGQALEDFYGEGGTLDKQHATARQSWQVAHPGETYPD